MTRESPGFRRMKERLGPDAAEKLRKDTLRQQEEALKSAKPETCSICQNLYTGFGNNAWPINDGKCCDDCNDVVIVARINQLKGKG